MKLDDLKTRWSGYSNRKKWTIAGAAALLCIAAAGGGNRDDQGSPRGGAWSHGSGRGYASEEPGQGQPYSGSGYAAAPQGVGGMGGYGEGAATGPAGTTVPDDTITRYEANERVKDRAAAAFDQNLRDESTLRDTGTGEVVTGVSNPVADAAVGSGAATVVPTNELPVSPDPSE